SYVKAGWFVLDGVVETVRGRVWEDAVRAPLLAPAGMRETIFATESDPAARVSGHQLTADGPVPVEPLAVPAFGPAGTSMLATASDMLRFAALHRDDPAPAVLRRPQPAARIHGRLADWCLR